MRQATSLSRFCLVFSFAVAMPFPPPGVSARRHPKPSDQAPKAEQATKKAKREKVRKPTTDVFYPTPP